jgi:hypothetical protein
MSKQNILIGILGVVLIVSIFFNVMFYVKNQDLKIAGEILYYESEANSAYKHFVMAEEYYNFASINYDYNEWYSAIDNCVLSRKESGEYTQKLRAIKAQITNDGEIFVVYKQMIDESIKIQENLYEACEYLESALRQYAVNDFEGGGSNIDLHNDKIRDRDNAVRKYNDLIEEYKIELGKLVGK